MNVRAVDEGLALYGREGGRSSHKGNPEAERS